MADAAVMLDAQRLDRAEGALVKFDGAAAARTLK